MRNVPSASSPLMVFVLAIPCLCALSREQNASAQTLHQIETAAAFDALKNGRYTDAIDHANTCIEEIGPTATRMQRDLTARNTDVPTGPVDDVEKKQIDANGPLNDVATCYYILGRCAEYRGKSDDITRAYQKAARFSYGRCWDLESQSFWSPAEAAANRLMVIRSWRTPWPPSKEVTHETLTALAWRAFNKNDYAEAIRWAERCVHQYHRIADKLQHDLQKTGVRSPYPPVGESEKKQIFANGPLNDVATCLFIWGRAAERLRKLDDARKAYRATAKYTCALCFDPTNESFWSVAVAAGDRLEALR